MKFSRFAATPDATDIGLTILAGTGSPATFNYSTIDGTDETGDLSKFRELPNVTIKPPVPVEGQANLVSYGAIEMDLTVPISDLYGGAVYDDGIAVILDPQPQNLINQTQLIWKRNGNNFKIMLLSPKGMYSYESRVSIVPRFPDFFYGVSATPVLNSVVYYDINGQLDSGPMPTLAVKQNPLFPF